MKVKAVVVIGNLNRWMGKKVDEVAKYTATSTMSEMIAWIAHQSYSQTWN